MASKVLRLTCTEDWLRLMAYTAVLQEIVEHDDEQGWSDDPAADAARRVLAHFDDLPEKDPQ